MTAPVNGLDGLLLVDKPGDTRTDRVPVEDVEALQAEREYLLTSHDVVQRVRRWSGQRRIGHSGTLDPMASGLLVLCLGWATRLVEYYQGHDKEYDAEILLGVATDTQDIEGNVIARAPVARLSDADVERALDRFRGEITQTPPVYSAVKLGGESAHRRARRGEVVEIAPRVVTFREITLVARPAGDRLHLHVRCSAGAYVRSLAADLGAALGTVATLSALRRTAAGAFVVGQARALPEIEAAAMAGTLTSLLLAPGDGLDLPVLHVGRDDMVRLGHGQAILPAEAPRDLALVADGPILAQARDDAGRLAGIVRRIRIEDSQNASWKAEKWFAAQPNADLQ